jgi:hypothetical protein
MICTPDAIDKKVDVRARHTTSYTITTTAHAAQTTSPSKTGIALNSMLETIWIFCDYLTSFLPLLVLQKSNPSNPSIPSHTISVSPIFLQHSKTRYYTNIYYGALRKQTTIPRRLRRHSSTPPKYVWPQPIRFSCHKWNDSKERPQIRRSLQPSPFCITHYYGIKRTRHASSAPGPSRPRCSRARLGC